MYNTYFRGLGPCIVLIPFCAEFSPMDTTCTLITYYLHLSRFLTHIYCKQNIQTFIHKINSVLQKYILFLGPYAMEEFHNKNIPKFKKIKLLGDLEALIEIKICKRLIALLICSTDHISPGNTNFSIFTIFGKWTGYIYRYSNNFTKYSKYWTSHSVFSVSNRSHNRSRMSDKNGGHRPALTNSRRSYNMVSPCHLKYLYFIHGTSKAVSP